MRIQTPLIQTARSQRRSRRDFLTKIGMGGLLYASPGVFAQELVTTPAQTVGPYYPNRMPLDLDNDLLRINDAITPAVGDITWLSGRVLGRNGLPLRNALVEIWQADNNGAYIHTASPITNRDANFQGYGKFVTGVTGEYLFRTVRPGLYPGRTRHIHAQITTATGDKLVTQVYQAGEPLNANDGVLQGIRDANQRNSVIVSWNPIAGSVLNEFEAKWDIVFGLTPAESSGTRPEILATNGVVNGAGYQAGITPGAWLSIFGDHLSDTTRTWNAQTEIIGGKLPLSLDGVSVTIDGKPAPVYHVSPNQINVQAPSDVANSTVQVVVTNAHGASTPVNAAVQTILPGFFVYGRSYVAASRPDGSFVAPEGELQGVASTPAKRGETIILYGTGFGATSPNVVSGEVFQGAAPLSNAVTIRIGTTFADVRFAGMSGAGLYQFNIVAPNVPDGDHDVIATIAGARSQSLARLRVTG
jgi:protocatechuate 3,4-dioxygenase, beta subunit